MCFDFPLLAQFQREWIARLFVAEAVRGIRYNFYVVQYPFTSIPRNRPSRVLLSLSLPLLSQWKRCNACANRKIIIVTPENDRFRAPPAKSQWFSYDRPMNGGRDLVEDMCLLSIRHPSGNIRQSFVICRRIVHGVPCLGKQRYIRCEVKKKRERKMGTFILWELWCDTCIVFYSSFRFEIFTVKIDGIELKGFRF